jgi:hypothetical protein
MLRSVSWLCLAKFTFLTHLAGSSARLKGTVPRDFSPLVLFFKQLLLVPISKHRNDFDFFRIFAEIFYFSGASPVSLTPVMHDVTGVNDTGKECINGVVDTGDVMHHRCC